MALKLLLQVHSQYWALQIASQIQLSMLGGIRAFEPTQHDFLQGDLSESNGAVGVSINQMKLHLHIDHLA